MERLETQTLLRSGVADIGKTLHEISVSADKILDNVSKYMDLLQGDELFLGESSNALIEKYEKFKNVLAQAKFHTNSKFIKCASFTSCPYIKGNVNIPHFIN